MKKFTIAFLILVNILIFISSRDLDRDSATAQQSYNVVFLSTSPEVRNLVSSKIPNITIVATFAELRSADSSNSIDGLITDRMTLASIDKSWLQQSYGRGVVIAALNTPAEELARGLASVCKVQLNETDNNYYIIMSRLLLARDPSDIQRINQSEQQTCYGDKAQGVTQFALLVQNNSVAQLANDNDYIEMKRSIDLQITNIKSAYLEFNEAR